MYYSVSQLLYCVSHLLGITVNALAPAVVRTAMVEGMNPAQVKYMTDKIPMQRLDSSISPRHQIYCICLVKRCCTLDEVASMTKFIVSKGASFNTGFCFDLTGGRSTY